MDPRNIKALFFDIDGTLAGYKDHQIDPRDMESLRKLKEKGLLLFIATGRDLLIPIEAKIAETAMHLMTGVINANGQQCYLTDGTEISYHPIDEEDLRAVCRTCVENHIAILYYIGHERFITEMTDHVAGFAARVGIPWPPVRPMDTKTETPRKLCLHIAPQDEARLVTPLLKHTYTARNTEHLIDLIPEGIGKDHGIREICDYFGISPDETMAFGDGENDITMLHAAGIGVAMASAEDHIKAEADYAAKSEEAGITEALNHFGLL